MTAPARNAAQPATEFKRPEPGWFDAEPAGGAQAAFAMPEGGMPIERLARLAARRTFVALKCLFIDAAACATGPRADWLRHQVRQSDDPVDLWLLRGLLLDALPGGEPGAQLRREVQRMLERVFPDNAALSAWRPMTR